MAAPMKVWPCLKQACNFNNYAHTMQGQCPTTIARGLRGLCAASGNTISMVSFGMLRGARFKCTGVHQHLHLSLLSSCVVPMRSHSHSLTPKRNDSCPVIKSTRMSDVIYRNPCKTLSTNEAHYNIYNGNIQSPHKDIECDFVLNKLKKLTLPNKSHRDKYGDMADVAPNRSSYCYDVRFSGVHGNKKYDDLSGGCDSEKTKELILNPFLFRQNLHRPIISSYCSVEHSHQHIFCRHYCTKSSNFGKDGTGEKKEAESAAKDLRQNIMTVPNLLTTSRIVMAPILGHLVLQEAFPLACGVFIIAGITDLLDGWIARNFKNQTSALGSFIDPLADKVLVMTLFFTLTMVNLLPVALTALVIVRDVSLIAAAFYVRYISLPGPITFQTFFDGTYATAQLTPMFISKVNTAVQLGLVTLSLAAPVFNFVDHPALHALWYLTAGTTLVSGVGYMFAQNTFKIMKQSRRKSKGS